MFLLSGILPKPLDFENEFELVVARFVASADWHNRRRGEEGDNDDDEQRGTPKQIFANPHQDYQNMMANGNAHGANGAGGGGGGGGGSNSGYNHWANARHPNLLLNQVLRDRATITYLKKPVNLMLPPQEPQVRSQSRQSGASSPVSETGSEPKVVDENALPVVLDANSRHNTRVGPAATAASTSGKLNNIIERLKVKNGMSPSPEPEQDSLLLRLQELSSPAPVTVEQPRNLLAMKTLDVITNANSPTRCEDLFKEFMDFLETQGSNSLQI